MDLDLDLDPRTSTIIMEFLLAQPISNRLASDLIRALPVSLDSPRIKIRFLLRRFSDFPLPFSSIKVLSFLELLFKLSPSPSIPTAYSAVALHLVARHRDDAGFKLAAGEIWNRRIDRLKKSEELKGLVSKRLEEDRELVMRVVRLRGERETLYARNTGKEAEVAVRVCLEEVTNSLGPSELEMAILASEKDGNPIGVSDKTTTTTTTVVEDVGINASQHEANQEGEGEERAVVNDVSSVRGGDIEASEKEVEIDPSINNAVGFSEKEVERMVVEEEVHISASQKEGNPARVLEEEERVRVDDVSVVGRCETDTSCDSPPRNTGNRMKANAVDVVQERVNTHSQSGGMNKGKKKKTKKYWSAEEEECLIQGIKEYEVGNWSAIRSKYTIFKKNGRRSVDLKDKYRNMMKKIQS